MGTALALTPAQRAAKYTEAANQASPQRVLGVFMKYVQGEYFVGQQNVNVPLGTRFVALLDKASHGFIKWVENRPAETRMVSVDEKKPLRKDVGDMDQNEWDLDEYNKPKDPWQDTFYLPLMNEAGELFTFSTSSVGGRGACATLLREYVVHLRDATQVDFPVVSLQSDSYVHPKRKNKVRYPVFKIEKYVVEKVVKDKIDAAVAEEEYQPEQQEDPGHGMDDEIPF